ncbi:MAG: hypothetical protein JSS09_02565 [Verrucomicrobia bacterium]|nr:hypothetical protein [Verrucomicrobiota bacterium]
MGPTYTFKEAWTPEMIEVYQKFEADQRAKGIVPASDIRKMQELRRKENLKPKDLSFVEKSIKKLQQERSEKEKKVEEAKNTSILQEYMEYIEVKAREKARQRNSYLEVLSLGNIQLERLVCSTLKNNQHKKLNEVQQLIEGLKSGAFDETTQKHLKVFVTAQHCLQKLESGKDLSFVKDELDQYEGLDQEIKNCISEFLTVKAPEKNKKFAIVKEFKDTESELLEEEKLRINELYESPESGTPSMEELLRSIKLIKEDIEGRIDEAFEKKHRELEQLQKEFESKRSDLADIDKKLKALINPSKEGGIDSSQMRSIEGRAYAIHSELFDQIALEYYASVDKLMKEADVNPSLYRSESDATLKQDLQTFSNLQDQVFSKEQKALRNQEVQEINKNLADEKGRAKVRDIGNQLTQYGLMASVAAIGIFAIGMLRKSS